MGKTALCSGVRPSILAGLRGRLRLNYTSQGAQRLEIIWWECPPEHWESLHFGGTMNFMETPVPILEENGKMTESQLVIAVAFVTELISLGVLD
jgi:hypothetical protein